MKWFMNDELTNPKPVSIFRPPLEQRRAHRPDVLARRHELADTLGQSVADEIAPQTPLKIASARRCANWLSTCWSNGRAKPTTTLKPGFAHAIRKPSNTVEKNAEVADPLWLGGSPASPMAAGTARRPAATAL